MNNRNSSHAPGINLNEPRQWKNYVAVYKMTEKQKQDMALQVKIGFGHDVYTSPYWYGLAVNRFCEAMYE